MSGIVKVAGTEGESQFLDSLVDAGHFLPSGEPGIYGRGEVFERARLAIDGLINRFSDPDRPETPRFPPIIPRSLLERAGYLKSFPNLCGSIFSFAGKEMQALELLDKVSKQEDWSGFLTQTDVVLVPAACYPAYPAMARRGPLPEDGRTLDLGGSYVFRNEPSGDPARLQMFHQREMIRMGTADQVIEWRERWMSRAVKIFEHLRLDAQLDAASDPFFGRGGKLLAKSQRELKLKFEVLVPISSPERTAVASFNYHQEHFACTFGLQLANGEVAQTACLGFGLERITLAMFWAHGLDIEQWPVAVREVLWPQWVTA